MINDKNLALMADIMGTIVQADEWQDIQLNDPMITDARNCWETILKRAKAFLPEDIYLELEDAEAGEVAATGNAGILFGIHVADAIRDVASRPADLSRHVLKRIEEAQA